MLASLESPLEASNPELAARGVNTRGAMLLTWNADGSIGVHWSHNVSLVFRAGWTRFRWRPVLPAIAEEENLRFSSAERKKRKRTEDVYAMDANTSTEPGVRFPLRGADVLSGPTTWAPMY